MIPDFTVTAFEPISKPPTPSGSIKLAFFTVKIPGVCVVRGCVLADTPEGRQAWTPVITSRNSDPFQGTRFSGAMHRAVTAAASAAWDTIQARAPANDHTVSAAVELVRQVDRRDAA
ncbi:hypothetical protein ACFPIF_02445 [Brevundimonas faecalis]|uniref:hypothetical protein n=1 Tax=Brevundimonas faecalis TaxID=947378 RepID=UPI0036155447